MWVGAQPELIPRRAGLLGALREYRARARSGAEPSFRLIAAIELINLLPLGGEQQKLDLVAKLNKLYAAVVPIASVLDVLEPVTVMGADRLHDFVREMAFRHKLVEPFDRCLDRLSPSRVLLGSLGVAFPTPGMGEAERADHRGQHQALTHQRH